MEDMQEMPLSEPETLSSINPILHAGCARDAPVLSCYSVIVQGALASWDVFEAVRGLQRESQNWEQQEYNTIGVYGPWFVYSHSLYSYYTLGVPSSAAR